MFKTHKIVEVDVKEPVEGEVYPVTIDDGSFYSKKIPRHLYVLSDDEIKEGDWYYWSVTKTIGQFKKENLIREPRETDSNTRFKIIATTDTSIILHEDIENIPPIIKHGRYGNGPESQYKIPQLSESFIQEYCERGGVDEVDVEYKKVQEVCPGDSDWVAHKKVLWVSPENTIHAVIPPQKVYTREEVIEKLHQLHSDLMDKVGGDIEFRGIDHYLEIVEDNL